MLLATVDKGLKAPRGMATAWLALQLLLCSTLLLVQSSDAATVGLSTNQSSYLPGNTLSLSASLVPDTDAGLVVDIYVAVVTPGSATLTLDSRRQWVTTLEPIVRGYRLAALQAPNFYQAPLSEGLASGTYTFMVVVVQSGQSPLIASNWLGHAQRSIVFEAGAQAANVELTTQAGSCTVNQYCSVPLVAGISGGTGQYSYLLDSLAYGTPPSLMTVDLLTGNLEGTPKLAGSYTFQLCAKDTGGNRSCKAVTVTVKDAPSPSTQAWVFIGGDVSLLTRLTLDGVVIKDTKSSNLAHYLYMSPGTHVLTATCTEVYCFSYLQLEAPSGYSFSPTQLRATPTEIPPGASKTFTFTLNKL